MAAAPDEGPTTRRLPCRPLLAPGQALDSYLEVLAEANHLTTADLVRQLTDAVDTTRFLMLDPTPTCLAELAALTGISPARIHRAVLATYDGTALDLTGLDQHRPYSFRTIAARGWLPSRTSQLCPRCLGHDAIWRLAWRLPTTTVCTRHRTYLLHTCPGCAKPFRASRHGLLRPTGNSPVCGNPIGARRHCSTDLTTLRPPRCDEDCLHRQHRYDAALEAGTAAVLGEQVTAVDYHHALRSLTILLLHIATATTKPKALPFWARRLHRERHALRPARAPRWGIAPPTDPRLRSRFLTTADRVLAGNDLEAATGRLAEWTDAVPSTPDGFLGWVADHTIPDPITTRLITGVHAPRRRLSRALDLQVPLTPDLANIPQVVPHDLYVQHLSGLFASRPEVVRTFASICLARTHPSVTTWATAANALGLPQSLGTKAAQACIAAQLTTPAHAAEAIQALAQDMPVADWRAREEHVRDMCRQGRWFTTWTKDQRPGTAPESKVYAIAWLWTHAADGHLSTSPDWPGSPTAAQRAAYRRFASSLTKAQGRALHDHVAATTTPHAVHEESSSGSGAPGEPS